MSPSAIPAGEKSTVRAASWQPSKPERPEPREHRLTNMPESPPMGAYIESYRRSLDDPEGFWREAAGGIDWDVEPSQILD